MQVDHGSHVQHMFHVSASLAEYMNGWNDDTFGWPCQSVAQVEIGGTSYLLYLRFRGSWKGFIVQEGMRVHDLARRTNIWSEEMLCGCHIHNLEEAKRALVSIFKKNLGIKNRVKFTRPRLI